MYVFTYSRICTMYGCNCVLSLCAENAHSQKLMNEYEKYQELQARNQKLQEDYERQLAEMEASREKALAELTAFYESRLQERALQLDQAQDEHRHLQKESNEMRQQIEEDSDREILDIRNRYERKLRDEKEENMRIKGDFGIMKKKVRMCICIYVCVYAETEFYILISAP